MKTTLKWFLLLVPLQLLFGLGQARAQVDPVTLLMGTWEGTVSLPRDNQRTIVIKSVKPKEGGGWVAEGTYAVDKAQRITADVSLKDGDVVIDFVVGSSKNPAHLKLVGERKLDGHLNTVGDGGRKVNRSMTLEKVESKKEEAK